MLNKAIVKNNILTSLDNGSSATSIPFTQKIVNDDYRKMKNIKIWYSLKNLSQQFGVDYFKTTYPLAVGDKVMLKYNDLFQDFIIPEGAIQTIDTALLTNYMSSNIDLLGNKLTVVNNYAAAYKIMNIGYTTNDDSITKATTPTLIFNFVNATVVKKIILNTDILQPVVISGSNNGIDYTTLYTGTNPAKSIIPITLTTTGSYLFYKVVMSGADSYIWGFNLLGDGIQVNTSLLTAGVAPQGAFKLPTIKMNEITLVEKITDRYCGGTNDTVICSNYDDITIYPTRQILTDITFNALGNQLTEFSGLVYNINLDTGNVIHTSNILPSNNVELTGANLPNVSTAYLAFDNDIASDAISIATDTTGVIDISHIYKFDIGTTIYKLKTKYGLAIEAPTAYTVSGSFDGVTYIELLNVTQNIAVDDLELTKSFDITKYDAYMYYKIHITAGNPSGKISFKQYSLLKESSLDIV